MLPLLLLTLPTVTEAAEAGAVAAGVGAEEAASALLLVRSAAEEQGSAIPLL